METKKIIVHTSIGLYFVLLYRGMKEDVWTDRYRPVAAKVHTAQRSEIRSVVGVLEESEADVIIESKNSWITLSRYGLLYRILYITLYTIYRNKLDVLKKDLATTRRRSTLLVASYGLLVQATYYIAAEID